MVVIEEKMLFDRTDTSRISQNFCDLYRKNVLNEMTNYEEKHLFYAFTEIPKYWQIFPRINDGIIVDNKVTKGHIYVKNDSFLEGITDRIEWVGEDDKVFKIDYYNQYGFTYCCRFYDNGVKAFDNYYTIDKRILFQINHSNGAVTKYSDRYVSNIYHSVADFIREVLRRVSQTEKIVVTSVPNEEYFTNEITYYTANRELIEKAAVTGFTVVELGEEE